MILTSMIALTMMTAPAQAETCVPAPAAGHAGARALPWYINGDAVTIGTDSYVKYGLPPVLRKGDVALFKPYKGGFFFAEAGNPQREVLYLLTDLNGCEFQPYQIEPK